MARWRARLDHAVEDICSIDAQPYSEGAALQAIRLLGRALPATKKDPSDPLAAERQALISQALGEPDTDAATLVTRLIAHLGLPTRLRDVGISTDAQLDAIAEAAMHDPWIRTNPRAIDSASVVRALLDEAR